MYIAFKSEDTALKSYFNYYFNKLKVGMVTSITGSPHLKTGTGKSYSALRIGEQNDPTFDMRKVVYYPKEFLQVMDLIEEIGKPGQVAVVDEGEITAPANLYYSFTNKAMFYTMSTFRYLRCMAIMVTPSFNWIDKRIRTLVAHWGYTEKRVVEGGRTEVRLKFYRVTTDLMGDKIYYRKLTMYNRPRERIQTFKHFKVSLPSEQLQIDYEKKSREFKKDLRRKLIPEIEKWEARDFKDTHKTPKEITDDIAKDPELIRQLTTQRGKMDLDAIKEKFNFLTFSECKRVKRLTEKLWEGG